jgi:hypothetical protein
MNNNQEIHLNLNKTVDDDDSDNHTTISVSISLPSSTEQLSTVSDSSDTESTYPEFDSDEWDDIEKECEYMAEQYLEDNALHMSSKQFFDNMALSVFDYMYSTGLDQQWCSEEDENDIRTFVKDVCKRVMQTMNIPTRIVEDYITYSMEPKEIDETLEWLSKFPVQVQRSAEWYAIRRTLFSASNLWKLFSTPAQYNSLIYEKCKDVDKLDGLSSSSYGGDLLSPGSRNWGIKYEPVSIMVYEHKYNTTVNTKYGCIPHESLPIGASPDGINNKPNTPKYGRMVEVKNIYNRVMDGIPSTEYWTQMQIQMTTCKLEYCDFLETRFKEYANSTEFENDNTHEYKGVVLFYVPRDGSNGNSHYVYVPLEIGTNKDALNDWFAKKSESLPDYFLYQISYWYLDEMICSLVERNDWWFQKTIPTIKESWAIVLKERKEGCEHRAPQKKTKPVPSTMTSVNMTNIDSINWDTPNSNTKTIQIVKLDS